MDTDRLYSILSGVAKPGQYTGGEVNIIYKDFDSAKVRVALVFPDKYEIGMSHLGLKILYDILNALPHVACERCYAPEPDMERKLRMENIPLFSLESKRPLADFDMIGFSLNYELNYTNMLNILDLSKIPLWQKDRNDSHPIVIAGGSCTTNAEPVADFLDAAVLGDGEEAAGEIVSVMERWKASQCRGSRADLLCLLSKIEGIYVPSLFKPEYNADWTIRKIAPLEKGYEKINKRIVSDLDLAPFPVKPVVPSVKIVHDRIGIEIQRGCARGCRFCQAGFIDRPVRQRSAEKILDIAGCSLKNTGLEQISLLSLSAADHACLVRILSELNRLYSSEKISISVPATRTEKLTPELVEQIKKVRKTGFTIAPEAGSERMRRIINKKNRAEDLYRAVENAFKAGWNLIKLYYMVGLPYEEDADVLGIAAEANACIQIGKKYTNRAELNVSLSSFVPKPHTPFQWETQMTIEETRRKYELVRKNLSSPRIRLKHHNPEMSYVEGILSRGDRRVAKLVRLAFMEGCRFDEWEEHFDFSMWQRALEKWCAKPEFYLHRRRDRSEVFAWDHLLGQLKKDFLRDEAEKAAATDDCTTGRCLNCGICDHKKIKNRVYQMPFIPQTLEKRNAVESHDPDGKRVKIRIRFSKTGPAKFVGHLELMEILKRAFRLLHLPCVYSEGFHPQMKISMGHPLPVGIESEWEYLDLELAKPLSDGFLAESFNPFLPAGVKILSAETIDRQTPSLYSSVKSVAYLANFEGNGSDWSDRLKEAIVQFRERNEFTWLRKKSGGLKTFNLKEAVSAALESSPQTVSFTTIINPEGSLKPKEVLTALFGTSEEELSRVRLKKIGVTWKNLAG